MVSNFTSQTEDAKVFASLKGINFLLKNFEIKAAIARLETYDTGSMSSGLLMFFLYLQAKVSLYHFSQTNSMVDLHTADNFMAELVRIGHDAGTPPRCPNYLYTRACIRYKLSINCDDDKERVGYRSHALRLAYVGAEKFKSLRCFSQLYKEILSAHS